MQEVLHGVGPMYCSQWDDVVCKPLHEEFMHGVGPMYCPQWDDVVCKPFLVDRALLRYPDECNARKTRL